MAPQSARLRGADRGRGGADEQDRAHASGCRRSEGRIRNVRGADRGQFRCDQRNSADAPPGRCQRLDSERGAATQLQLNIDKGLGSIQAFFADPSRNRSVILVTTTSNWALVDPLFNYFNGPNGDDWTQLKGDVLAAGESGNPVNVAIRQAAAPPPSRPCPARPAGRRMATSSGGAWSPSWPSWHSPDTVLASA